MRSGGASRRSGVRLPLVEARPDLTESGHARVRRCIIRLRYHIAAIDPDGTQPGVVRPPDVAWQAVADHHRGVRGHADRVEGGREDAWVRFSDVYLGGDDD